MVVKMVGNKTFGGRALMIAFGITALILVVVGGAGAATPISSCGTISLPGEYILTQNIENYSTGTCIAITSNDVVFDGANYAIDGVTKNYTYGVYVNNQLTTLTQVTVKNLKVTDWYYGIYYLKVQNGSITNSIVSLNGNESLSIVGNNNSHSFPSKGIHLDHSNDISITNNTINSNNQSGISLSQSSNNNILKNNIDSNKFNGVMLTNDSSNNNIENNQISNHSYQGITVSGSSNNIIKNNNIENNEDGVVLGIWIINMSAGIEVYSNNNTLNNNSINLNNQSGITLSRSCNNNILNNNTINSNNQNGIFLTNSSNNNIENNKISNNQYGIKLSSSSSNNAIYNNYFNNINNYILKKNFDNRWNISRISGINIIGGSYLGGNFWAYPNGTGFSQTCPDTNNDGICDSSYELDINNTDYLPLSMDFTSDTTPPSVTNAITNQSVIPDDTDNQPLWGETAQLNVTVTDDSGIASVTVNLSEIGGSSAKPMTNIAGNIYSTTTNATSGTLPKSYNLTVNATDIFGNSNTNVRIQLRVMKNGDCTGNGIVNIGDALRLANNVSYPGNPAYALSSPYVCEVTGNGIINIGDALRLANNVSYPGNQAYVLK